MLDAWKRLDRCSMSDGQMPLTHIKQATETDEERIWRLAASAQREECAKVLDAEFEAWPVDGTTETLWYRTCLRTLVAKIRARGAK